MDVSTQEAEGAHRDARERLHYRRADRRLAHQLRCDCFKRELGTVTTGSYPRGTTDSCQSASPTTASLQPRPSRPFGALLSPPETCHSLDHAKRQFRAGLVC